VVQKTVAYYFRVVQNRVWVMVRRVYRREETRRVIVPGGLRWFQAPGWENEKGTGHRTQPHKSVACISLRSLHGSGEPAVEYSDTTCALRRKKDRAEPLKQARGY
jgi:hypothetical protein